MVLEKPNLSRSYLKILLWPLTAIVSISSYDSCTKPDAHAYGILCIVGLENLLVSSHLFIDIAKITT